MRTLRQGQSQLGSEEKGLVLELGIKLNYQLESEEKGLVLERVGTKLN